MKQLFLYLFFALLALPAFGQGVRPDQRPEITAPVASDEFYTQARGTLQRIRLDTLRRFLGVEIDTAQRAYNPADSVAATDRFTIIHAADGNYYYIDKDKQYLQLTGGSGAVSSVNSQTGVVVLDADDIDDAATTNKFATAAQLSKVDSDADQSATNEIQTITIDSSGTSFTITLSDSGGAVTFADTDTDTQYSAGTGISVVGTTINNTGDTDASDDLTTATTFAGDVTGLYNALQIATGAVGATELASTAVAAGSYTAADITVDADGRLTSASSGSVAISELSAAAQDSLTIGRAAVFNDAPAGSTQTISINNKTVGIFQIDYTGASSPLTLTVNNPVDGGVYTFHHRNVTSQDVTYPANFYNADGTSLGTVTYTDDDFLTCYYDGSNFYCK